MLEDLSDTAEEASDQSEPSRKGAIICVAESYELDETAAFCLKHLLQARRGIGGVMALSTDAPASNNLSFPPLRNAALVCLSLISTGSPVPARYLARRLRRRAPRATVIVGFWGLPTELQAREVIPATTADAVLRDAVVKIDEFVAPGNHKTLSGSSHESGSSVEV
jgi:hypothetical protein